MKRLFMTMLALMLVFGMGSSVFATEPAVQGPKISHTYQVNNGTAPEETFTFSFRGVSYKNGEGTEIQNPVIPKINDVKIAHGASAETVVKDASAGVKAADYEIGYYTYEVTQSAGTTAGVTYSEEKIYLVLTIYLDSNGQKQSAAAMHYGSKTGEKTKGFTTKYDAGSLTVKKIVAGNMATTSKKFTFQITLQDPQGKTIKSTIASDSTAGSWSQDRRTYTIDLGNNETVTLSNIPAGTTYQVVEEAGKYLQESSYSDRGKVISAGDRDTVTVTNTLNGEIDTGIMLDNMPYVCMLSLAGTGLLAFYARKRMCQKR